MVQSGGEGIPGTTPRKNQSRASRATKKARPSNTAPTTGLTFARWLRTGPVSCSLCEMQKPALKAILAAGSGLKFGEQVLRMNGLGEDFEFVALGAGAFKQVGGRGLAAEYQ